MPPLPLFHLLVAASLAEPSAGNMLDPGMCQKSVACGDSVDVRYPFFLTAATAAIVGNTAYSYCGYPGMAIICEGGRATLRLKGNEYTVLNINYEDHTVTVADTEVLSGGDCPRVTRNVTVPPEAWLNISTTASINLSFFFDCVFTAATPPPPARPPINCSSFPGRDRVSYVVEEPDVAPADQWPRACKGMVVVPVLKELLLGSDEYLARLNSDGYGKVLKQGFQLSWDPSAGPCSLCEQSKGQCSYNQSGEFIGCLCSDGSVRNPDCGPRISEKKNTTYIVSAVSGSILLFLLLSICALHRKKFHIPMPWEWGSKHISTIESFLQKHEAQYPKRYTYSEVKRMTKFFAHKLGQGGFGIVYKGNLPNGQDIAVKVLNESKDKDDGQEFMNEIASIMRTSHINVVTLLGYCIEGYKRALIY
ncbi:LEAF RUST 10 DISEASE-RESISTANCE LOCUS RECEPTOR-LIKE PROTEIN KINASE-like 2.7 [Panicum hallii]|nr:LEAF RUST 10 DISEASE-RESISTANCE LOCUS RECEPTOR-LIKE PROTEIN KINASE-like 2.7 [Panicum hallii]